MVKKIIRSLLLLAHVGALAQNTDYRTNQDQQFLYASPWQNSTLTNGFEKSEAGIADASSIASQSCTGELRGQCQLLVDATTTAQEVVLNFDGVEPAYYPQNCEFSFVYKGDASLYTVQLQGLAHAPLTTAVALDNAGTDIRQALINYPCSAQPIWYLSVKATSNSAAPFILDDPYAGPARNIGSGAVITQMQAYTPTISAWSTNTTATGFWFQQGQYAVGNVNIALTGAPTGTLTSVSLPGGCVADTSRISGYASNTKTIGDGTALAAATGNYGVEVTLASTTTMRPNVMNVSGTRLGPDQSITATDPGTFANGDYVSFNFAVPCVGWAATATAVSTNQRLLPTVQRFTSGSGTYTLPAGVVYIRVQAVGGGGGGQGSGSAAGTTAVAGGDTTFGSSLITAGGGGIGNWASGAGGAGGTATVNSPAVQELAPGGGDGGPQHGVTSALSPGAMGGSSFLGGAGRGGQGNTAGSAGKTNTGGGGGGGGISGVASGFSGPGGGAGAFVAALITSPSATYSYSVGTSGTAGTAGTSGFAGGAGAAGYIEVTEFYSSAAPFLTGSVTSNSQGLERMERAELNCDAASSITGQSGAWLSAIGNRSTTSCAVTIASGIFASTPTCSFTVKATTVQATAVNMTSATAGTVYAANADYDGYFMCMGPR